MAPGDDNKAATQNAPAVRIETLGCKVNQADSDALAAELLRRGHRMAEASRRADICVVNTCTVTQVADAKARKLIRRLVRDNPQAAVIVTGCYAERAAADLARIPGVARVVPNRDKDDLPRVIEELCGRRRGQLAAFSVAGPRAARPGSVRAFVKVQDGCDHGCSFCIVPVVRGEMRSRPVEEAVAEMRALAEAGAREVVICGIRLGAYGKETGGAALAQLLRATGELPLARLRLSSVEPWDVSDELLAEMARHPLLCPHVHLPLQSADDDVLRAMGRPYSYADYRRVVARLHDAIPDIAITTDIMVGFPGESDAAFAETCRAIEQIGFARVHVFRYSRRPGTRAAAMPGQVPERIKTVRSDRVSQVAEESARRFAGRLVGRVVSVLFEEWAGGMCTGLTDTYVPAQARTGASLAGEVAGVRVTAVESSGVTGEIVPPRSVSGG